jgi:arginine decarboxylase
MSGEIQPHEPRIDQFISGPGARVDRWRELLDVAAAWSSGTANRAKFEAALAELSVLEEYYGYPGMRLLGALRESTAEDDARTTLRMVRNIVTGLTTRSFQRQPDEREGQETGESVPDLMPPALGRGSGHRPYFETLIVTGVPATNWPALASEWRGLRRPLDAFIYEPVFVGSFEVLWCLRLAARARAEARSSRTRPLSPVQPQGGGDGGEPEG